MIVSTEISALYNSVGKIMGTLNNGIDRTLVQFSADPDVSDKQREEIKLASQNVQNAITALDQASSAIARI